MIAKSEETVLDNKSETLFCKTPGLNKPKNYVLTQNRFNTYMVLIFSVLNRTQIYEMPHRVSPNPETEIFISYNLLNLFELNKRTEDYHNRKPNDKNFPFEIEDKIYIYVGENLVTFEANEKLVNYSSDLGSNNFKYSFAYSEENLHFKFHQNYTPLQDYETSRERNEYQYLFKKDDEIKFDNITDENEGKI